MICLLGVAAALKPNEQGYGTHCQLGLPPCTFHVLFGRRCPTCGATTAFARMARGDWSGAIRANVGGAALAVLAIVASPWLLLSAVRGQWLGPRSRVEMAVAMVGVIMAIMLVDWAIRLVAG